MSKKTTKHYRFQCTACKFASDTDIVASHLEATGHTVKDHGRPFDVTVHVAGHPDHQYRVVAIDEWMARTESSIQFYKDPTTPRLNGEFVDYTVEAK